MRPSVNSRTAGGLICYEIGSWRIVCRIPRQRVQRKTTKEAIASSRISHHSRKHNFSKEYCPHSRMTPKSATPTAASASCEGVSAININSRVVEPKAAKWNSLCGRTGRPSAIAEGGFVVPIAVFVDPGRKERTIRQMTHQGASFKRNARETI